MKYITLVAVTVLSFSCATHDFQDKTGPDLEQLISNGENVYFEDERFEDEIDFTSFVSKNLVSDGVYESSIKSSITFKNCVFDGAVRGFRSGEGNSSTTTLFLSNLSFINCTFKEEVNFRGSTVHGKTDFTKSTFKNRANFEELSFKHNAYFSGCKFEGEHRFQNTFFLQKANFMNTEYFENASFQHCIFNAEFQISASKFYKYADFSVIDSRGNILLNYAEFRDRADFSNSNFGQNLDFVNTQNSNTNFNNCKFMGSVKFFKSNVLEVLSLKNCFFLFGKPEVDFLENKVLFD